MSLSGSIVWTRLARDRWAALGLDSQSSNRSVRLTRVASASRAPKARAAVSKWNCHWRTATRKARNEMQHSEVKYEQTQNELRPIGALASDFRRLQQEWSRRGRRRIAS